MRRFLRIFTAKYAAFLADNAARVYKNFVIKIIAWKNDLTEKIAWRNMPCMHIAFLRYFHS